MLANVAPPSVERCHCNVGASVPVAATVKVAALPAMTDWFAGWVVKVAATGAGLTVSKAALLVTLPALLLTTTR